MDCNTPGGVDGHVSQLAQQVEAAILVFGLELRLPDLERDGGRQSARSVSINIDGF